MKTALKIIGGIIATLVAAVAIFYFGWLSPPSPEAVCDNVMKITQAEIAKSGASASDADLTEARNDCVKKAGKAPEFGRGPWVEKLKCMRDATDAAALDKCGGR
ncbi:MAG: hypothetical protein JKY37_30250 [Nannocystaceae bacterium]|nr:hypothetical protein [Nannocystaceae bacterium]